MPRYAVRDHLLIPFAAEKWKIEDIRIAAVTTRATYFEAQTPLAYIDRTSKRPLTLSDFHEVYLGTLPNLGSDFRRELQFVEDTLIGWCDERAASEGKFIKLYFKYLRASMESWSAEKTARFGYEADSNVQEDKIWHALLPLPQAHLYLEDPLAHNTFDSTPAQLRMVKVDFAFWTGKKIVAVEVDGQSHVGNELHVQRDRWLGRAGVDVIHILNSELVKYGPKVITKLLPYQIVRFSEGREHGTTSPFDPIPF